MSEGAAYRTIRELASDERPREKLIAHGASVLSNAELIAIVLSSGLKGENVLDLARRILDEQGGLAGIMRADVRALQMTRGLGPARAAQVAAAVELGRRAGEVSATERRLMDTPEAVFAFIGPRMLGKTREELYVIALDTKRRLVGAAVALKGGISSIQLRPADVFREAMLLDAHSVVLAHNHPSGDPAPSPQDVAVTKDLVAAGELLGIEVADHVVIGGDRFVSLRRDRLGFR